MFIIWNTYSVRRTLRSRFFSFNDSATTEIYTLSLHDALPIWKWSRCRRRCSAPGWRARRARCGDRKSTRLNSSHLVISYAVFCLKKKIRMEDVLSIFGNMDKDINCKGNKEQQVDTVYGLYCCI